MELEARIWEIRMLLFLGNDILIVTDLEYPLKYLYPERYSGGNFRSLFYSSSSWVTLEYHIVLVLLIGSLGPSVGEWEIK